MRGARLGYPVKLVLFLVGWSVLACYPASGIGFSGDFSVSNAASLRVPLHHWAYDALEQLTTDGLLSPEFVSHRPLSRREIGSAVALLRHVPPGRVSLVRTLEQAFSSEVDARKESVRSAPFFRGHLEAETFLLSSSRAFRSHLDAYAPFDFAEGGNLRLKVSLGVEAGPHVAAFVAPTVLARKGRAPVGRFDTGYVLVRARGIDLLYGRDETAWGPGYRGNFVVTDNPSPLDVVRVDGKRGRLRCSTIIAGIKPLRDVDHSNAPGEEVLFHGLRIGWSGSKADVQVHVGTVFPYGRWGNALRLWGEYPQVDRVVELGGSFYPVSGVKLYGAVGSDDLRGAGVWRALWSGRRRTGYIVGGYFSDPLEDRKTDVRFEVARLDEHGRGDWYSLLAGYAHHGSLLGHPLGRRDPKGSRRDERDLFLRITHRLSVNTLLRCAYDRQSAILTFQPVITWPEPTWITARDYISYVTFQTVHFFGERWILETAVDLFFTLKEVMRGYVWSHRSDQFYSLRATYRVL